MLMLSGVGGVEGFRSLAGSTSTATKAANPRRHSDPGGTSYGSFANLKITAEKLAEEQASLKTDLEMAHVSLRRATEQINLLEGKLEQAVSENAKLKVKQTEDSKLCQGLNSKLSSTKTLCDQLTETLQQLASQIEQGQQEILRIKQEKEEMVRSYKERLYSNDTTIKEKDSLIKQLEGSVDENKSRLMCLNSRLQCMEQELKLKDDVCISLKGNLASSESEKNSLELMNKGHILKIEELCQDNKNLKEFLSSFMVKVIDLDEEHASISNYVSRLISSFERFCEMSQEEKMLMARSSKEKFEHLQRQYGVLISEYSALETEIEELESRLVELRRTQEIVMVQHVEECQVAEDKIRRLESEAEVSNCNINQLEKLASELQGRIHKLLEDSTLAEYDKQESLQKTLKLESDNQELLGQVQFITEEKSNNAESLQGEITKRDQQVNTLENQINQLRIVLDEKEQLYRCSVGREMNLQDQKLQVEASLLATKCQLSEAKRQYDLMLERKKIELCKQLKELSLESDQAINEICKKYELVVNAEKAKAEKLIREIENKCDEKISQNKHDFKRHLIRLNEEHDTKVAGIQQDNERKESNLRAYLQELQRIQFQAENELRERLSSLRKEHEIQIRSLRMHHEKECQRMQEELELQKSKQDDDVWDKRQIMYVLVLTTTAGFVFLLQPLLPVAYSRWIILAIAAVWGVGSIGLPFGLYGTTRCEKEFSRHIGRLVYTLFSVLVIFGFYLLAIRTVDTPAPTSPPSLKEAASDIDNTWWNIWFCAVGLIVLIGNLWSWIRGCRTGGDRDI